MIEERPEKQEQCWKWMCI